MGHCLNPYIRSLSLSLDKWKELKKEVKWTAYPIILRNKRKIKLLGKISPSEDSQWNKLDNFIGTNLEVRGTNLYFFVVQLTIHNLDLTIERGYQLSWSSKCKPTKEKESLWKRYK